MSSIDTTWANYWAKARQTGRTLFVIKRGTALGALMFGMLVIVPRIFNMVDNESFPLIALIIFILLGYGLAVLLWLANEHSYNKHLKNTDANSAGGEPDE